MSLMENAEDFMRRLNETIQSIPAVISTMTISIQLNIDIIDNRLDLSRVLREITCDKIKDFLNEIAGCEDAIYTSCKKSFHNSIIFKTNGVPTETDGVSTKILKKQSIKLFCNGNIHITGVKDVRDALYLADVFITILEIAYGGNGMGNMFPMQKYDIQLINFYFDIPSMLKDEYVLDLNKVLDELTKNICYYVSYNTERHAGIIVKALDFTIMIFESGSVLISSIKTLEQLEKAKDFIHSNIYQLVDTCCVKKVEIIPMKKTKGTNDFDYSKYIVLK